MTQPDAIRGIYESWPACRAAVSGVAGARFQAVRSRATAEAMLRGEGVALPPGTYAFVDGNHHGGIGVVLVTQPPAGPVAVTELATTVADAFRGAELPGLDTPEALRSTLGALRNVLAELGGLYAALRLVPAGSAVTVVHDYEGVGAWMEGRWKARDPVVAMVVAACQALVTSRRLTVSFRRQPGHESTFAGRNDFAIYNGRADRLATEGARERPRSPAP